MRLQHIIVTLLLLSPSFCISMNKTQVTIHDIMTTLAEIESLENSNIITQPIIIDDKKFRDTWGYTVPNRLVDKTVVTKTGIKKSVCVPQSYVSNDKKILEEINIDNLLTKSKKIIQTPKTNNDLSNKKKLLEQEIARQQIEKKELEQQIASLEKKYPQQKINSPQNKHIAAQKKKSASKKNPQTMSPAEQTMKVMRSLMNKYQAKNQVQLKQKLSEECITNCCLYVRFNQYCTWKYCSEKNILDIDTNDPESSADETGSESL